MAVETICKALFYSVSPVFLEQMGLKPLLEEDEHFFVGVVDAFGHQRVAEVAAVEVAVGAGLLGLVDLKLIGLAK